MQKLASQIVLVPKTESRSRATTTLIEVRVWTLLVTGVAYWGNVVRTSRHTDAAGLDFILGSVLDNGAFCAAAWAMIAAWAGKVAHNSLLTSRSQMATGIAISLLCAVPDRQATIAALIVLGIVLSGPAGTHAGRSVAALLIALAFDMAWTSSYFMPLHTSVAIFDARSVEALLGLVGIHVTAGGNVVDNQAMGFNIEILARCTSSFPLASVVLAFVVTMLYRSRHPAFRDWPWLCASIVASLVLTHIRLAWMASREADFLWLHEGDGVILYTLAALGLAVLFPLLATRDATAAGARR